MEFLHHALHDSIKMLPFLFAAYLLIEFIEDRHSEKIESILAGGGRFGFVPGAILGLVPQCGFSAMAANLYSSKVITLGTLVAVFLSTSDEAIPILIANPEYWKSLSALLAVKLCVAIAAGFCIDFVFRKRIPAPVRGGYTGTQQTCACRDKQQEHGGILKAAIKHTAHIFGFILLFNTVLGALVHGIGQETVSSFLVHSGAWQPLLAGLVGLVPNCAASVLITQLYAAGSLSFGGAVAGLCTGAGVGLAVLLRTNQSAKQNCLIVGLLYGIGVGAGYLCQWLA